MGIVERTSSDTGLVIHILSINFKVLLLMYNCAHIKVAFGSKVKRRISYLNHLLIVRIMGTFALDTTRVTKQIGD
ncbi:hypothetical protein C0J52_14632 [Blattella germanica]|nr:hypothetical protein C0J52_14632 [Blattella germanica]